mmetsp:Transcript_4294/g.12512  ORF Transcript_4294/g.12512 Transcript_4294/m.12512 type:complete len:345 (-) Transcript_4294:805-1839(-)
MSVFSAKQMRSADAGGWSKFILLSLASVHFNVLIHLLLYNEPLNPFDMKKTIEIRNAPAPIKLNQTIIRNQSIKLHNECRSDDSFLFDIDMVDGDMSSVPIREAWSANECCTLCQTNPKCTHWSFNTKVLTCWLKNSARGKAGRKDTVSGRVHLNTYFERRKAQLKPGLSYGCSINASGLYNGSIYMDNTTNLKPDIAVGIQRCFAPIFATTCHHKRDSPQSDQVHRPQRAPLRQLLAPGDQHDAPGRHGAVRARLPGGRRRPLLPAVPPTTPPQLQERLPPPSQAVPASGVRHDHVRRQQSILRRLVPRDAPQRLPRHRAPPRPPRPRRLQLPAFQPASDEAR